MVCSLVLDLQNKKGDEQLPKRAAPVSFFVCTAAFGRSDSRLRLRLQVCAAPGGNRPADGAWVVWETEKRK